MYAYLVYYILGFIMIPGIILGIYAQTKVHSTFEKYGSVQSSRGRVAKDVARIMLDGGNCRETQIKEINGQLTDNYNPKTNTVSLSQSVANKSSISAIGVAAHEVGHVFQHKQKYAPLKIRNALVPVLNYSSILMWPLIIFGLIFEIAFYSTWSTVLIYIGIGIYAINILFCLITLPVELNASKRAYDMLISTNEMDVEEAKMAKKVLNAAALTYVAALITSVLSLIRVLLFVFAMRGDRR